MISNDMKKKINIYVDNFIKNALHNNYAVIDDSVILDDIREEANTDMINTNDEEILSYIYDLIKTDTRIHFYGIGEAYNYEGKFEAITDDPVITSKVFDNPFDAINEEK